MVAFLSVMDLFHINQYRKNAILFSLQPFAVTACSYRERRTQSQVSFSAVEGTVYQIAVDGAGGVSGDIQLDLTLVVAGPPNDNFANAATLTGTFATASDLNVAATKESGEPNHANNPGGRSLWWTWTAPTAGTVTLSTAASNFDTLLAVYTGSSVAALTEVASNNDFFGNRSQVQFSASAGTTYQIAVDGFDAAFGTIALEVIQEMPAPPNDDFADAILLSGTSATDTASNQDATTEFGEPFHAGKFGGTSIWWRWTAPSAGRTTISTLGSSFDTMLAVYTGTSMGALTEVASNDDADGILQSQLSFAAGAGTTYQIVVDGYVGETGSVSLALSHTAVTEATNDDFANAISLSGGVITSSGSNEGATSELDEPNHAGTSGGTSVWWSWTAPNSGVVDISTVGSSFDTLLAVYTGTTVASLTEVASNDDFVDLASKVSFLAVEGTTYRIAVDGFGGEIGNIELTLTQTVVSALPNDDFINAITVSGNSVNTTGSNVGASREIGEPPHASQPGGKSVWWTWTAPTSGTVSISTDGSSFDTTLAVYTGSSVAALTEVASNDDFIDLASSVSFTVTAGTEYHLAVDGFGGAFGNIALSISHTTVAGPANDNFTNATLLMGSSAVANASNVGATKEPGEPNHAGNTGGSSLWWNWEAHVSGIVNISTVGSSFDTILAVYTGAAVTALAEVTSNDDFVGFQSEVTFDAMAGTTYRIAVDGYEGAAGDIVLSLFQTVTSANDDFADAIPLVGSSIITTGSNEEATKELGEPDHAGDPGGKSLWWTWTASTSSVVAISTRGSNFDTTLGVYSFFFDELIGIAANDDFVGLQSQVVFIADFGTTYWIAVDGFDGASGDVAVTLTETAITLPDNDDFANAITLAGSAVTTTAHNLFASEEFGEPDHAGNLGGSSVWWEWTAPTNDMVTISTRGSTFDTTLGIYTGSSFAALAEVASNDDIDLDLGITQSEVTFNAVANTSYRIAVDGFGDILGAATGAIALSIISESTPPAVEIVAVTPDPGFQAVDEITILFDAEVVGFDLSDLALTRDGGENLLADEATLITFDSRRWTLGNLANVTDQPGMYQLALTAAASGIETLSGAPLAVGAVETWTDVRQPGDANLDGSVDGSDFGIWNSNKFRINTSWISGDFNNDGVTDGTDFNIWNDNRFVAAAGSLADAAHAPSTREPRAALPHDDVSPVAFALAVDVIFSRPHIELGQPLVELANTAEIAASSVAATRVDRGFAEIGRRALGTRTARILGEREIDSSQDFFFRWEEFYGIGPADPSEPDKVMLF